MTSAQTVLDPQERFSFGKNWTNFLQRFDEDRAYEAEVSLKKNLGVSDLNGKTFLDVGSGSGLFSLAAYRLGARVFSFDYDPDSVSCTKFLRNKYANNKSNWTIEQGSVLDSKFLEKFGKADVLYSWGVLHHTGQMYTGFENVSHLVKPNGHLFISIYNDQGSASKRWTWIKKKYINGNKITRLLLIIYSLFRFWGLTFTFDLLRTGNFLTSWKSYGKNNRGMSPMHDLIDWVGGYPFEVAKPEDVFEFFKSKGFRLEKLKTSGGGITCNEFVFMKE